MSLSAQENKTIIVTAGTKVDDYYTFNERYLYPEFIPGVVVFSNGTSSDIKFNYNILHGEVEFIQSNDTMALSRKKGIIYIAAQDTLIFDNGYIRLISVGQPRVGVKQYVKIKDILKKGAYGTSGRSVSIDSYSVSSFGVAYGLTMTEDIELQNVTEYYISNSPDGFVLYTKRNVLQIFPENSDDIKSYIKINKIDFESRDDLLKLADYLRSL